MKRGGNPQVPLWGLTEPWENHQAGRQVSPTSPLPGPEHKWVSPESPLPPPPGSILHPHKGLHICEYKHLSFQVRVQSISSLPTPVPPAPGQEAQTHTQQEHDLPPISPWPVLGVNWAVWTGLYASLLHS